ncbi:MAG: malonate decarboxylase subunit epsilon [Balneolaceae bacterium]
MKVAYLFPGQGSQYPGMLHGLASHPSIEQSLKEAGEVVKDDILLWDTEKSLHSTVATQILLLVAGVAAARTLQEEGAQPDMVAGHSVGAFGAAVTAGILDFKETVSLVKLRGELMEEAFPSKYGMGVVTGIRETDLRSLLKESVSEGQVYMANLNSPSQITITGTVQGIKKVLSVAQKEGARTAELLPVRVPSHCTLMEPVSTKLLKALNKMIVNKPRIPFASNRTARVLRDAQSIREELAFSITQPVRWHDATSVFFEKGVRLFVEMPPGCVLTGLAGQAFPDARAVSVDNAGIQSTRILVNRMKDEI